MPPVARRLRDCSGSRKSETTPAAALAGPVAARRNADRAPPPGSARTASSRTAPSRPAAGRSEMSSPGHASWCICVRMSPGSTTPPTHPARASSTASVRVTAARAPPCSRRTVPTRVGRRRRVARDVHDEAAPCGQQRRRRAASAPAGRRRSPGTRVRSRGTSNSMSGPMGPSTEALLTSTSRPPSSRAASIQPGPDRCVGDVARDRDHRRTVRRQVAGRAYRAPRRRARR